jgi:hypothetical protein
MRTITSSSKSSDSDRQTNRRTCSKLIRHVYVHVIQVSISKLRFCCCPLVKRINSAPLRPFAISPLLYASTATVLFTSVEDLPQCDPGICRMRVVFAAPTQMERTWCVPSAEAECLSLQIIVTGISALYALGFTQPSYGDSFTLWRRSVLPVRYELDCKYCYK